MLLSTHIALVHARLDVGAAGESPIGDNVAELLAAFILALNEGSSDGDTRGGFDVSVYPTC
jgi:hypothetical protein